jgi:hypothetical protein
MGGFDRSVTPRDTRSAGAAFSRIWGFGGFDGFTLQPLLVRARARARVHTVRQTPQTRVTPLVPDRRHLYGSDEGPQP